MLIDTVAWVRVEGGRVLCARPRGKDVFYVPGGKREAGESDLQVLLREISEELTVALLPATIRPVGVYEAHQPGAAPVPGGATPPGDPAPAGDPPATLVRMSCYSGDYRGALVPSSEIDELAWFGYADRPRVPAVDQLLFDDLAAAGQLR